MFDAVPLVHGTVAGRPTTDWGDEKVHVVACFTFAESVTAPPAAVSVVVLAVNEVTLGALLEVAA